MSYVNNNLHIGELAQYAWSYTSQGGEDGILQEIFKRLDINQGNFLEVGASDSIFLSNTRYLIEHNWNGIYIEADKDKFIQLVKNVDNATCYNAKINCESLSGLDDFIKGTQLDLLSLDIDSLEYWILKDLKAKPKVVVVEYNSNFEPNEKKTVEYDPKHSWDTTTNYYGASAGALNQVMVDKGYTLVCCVEILNLIFIRNDLMGKFKALDIGQIRKIQNFAESTRKMIDVS